MTEKFILNLCRITHEKLSISFEISISTADRSFAPLKFSCLYILRDAMSSAREKKPVMLSAEQNLFIEMEMFWGNEAKKKCLTN